MSELEKTPSSPSFVTACSSVSKSSVSSSASKVKRRSESSFSQSSKRSNSTSCAGSKSNVGRTGSRPSTSKKRKASKVRRRRETSGEAGVCKSGSKSRKGKSSNRSWPKGSTRRSSKVRPKPKKSSDRSKREAKLHNLTIALDPSVQQRAIKLTKRFKIVARRGRTAWVKVLGGTIMARDGGILLMMGLKSIQQAIKATEALDQCIGSRDTQACIANCMYIMQVSRVNLSALCKKSGFSYVRGFVRKRSCDVVVRVYESGKIIAIGRKLEATKKAVENVAAEI